MSDKTDLLFRAFLNLTDDEKKTLQTKIDEYLSSSTKFRESLEESSVRTFGKSLSVSFGPVPGGCPVCGR